jgi:hypothetical protein
MEQGLSSGNQQEPLWQKFSAPAGTFSAAIYWWDQGPGTMEGGSSDVELFPDVAAFAVHHFGCFDRP